MSIEHNVGNTAAFQFSRRFPKGKRLVIVRVAVQASIIKRHILHRHTYITLNPQHITKP